VVDGVAEQVHERIGETVEDRAVELSSAAAQLDLDLPAQPLRAPRATRGGGSRMRAAAWRAARAPPLQPPTTRPMRSSRASSRSAAPSRVRRGGAPG
jgi:hypothetical protein